MASQAFPSLAFLTASLFSFAALKRVQVQQQLEKAERLQDMILQEIALLASCCRHPLFGKREVEHAKRRFYFSRTQMGTGLAGRLTRAGWS
jgi:hypothetical protein